MSDKEFQKKVGESIRKMRKAKGISLRQFETMEGGVDRGTQSKIENGSVNISLGLLKTILSCLDSNLKEFFMGFDEN